MKLLLLIDYYQELKRKLKYVLLSFLFILIISWLQPFLLMGQTKTVPVIEYKKNLLDLLDLEINTKINYRTQSSTFAKTSIRDAPGSITHFSQVEIEKMGVTTLMDVLDQVPGISIVSNSGLMTSIALRGIGLENGNYSVYLDGVKVNDNFSGSAALFLQYSVDNILEITVISSPTSDVNGTSSGLLTIWMKTSNLNRQSSRISGYLAGGLTGMSKSYIDIKNEKRLNNGLSYFLAVNLLQQNLSNLQGPDIHSNTLNFNELLPLDSRKINMGLQWKDLRVGLVSSIEHYENYYIGNQIFNHNTAAKVDYDLKINNDINSTHSLYYSLGTYSNEILNGGRNAISSNGITALTLPNISAKTNVNFFGIDLNKNYRLDQLTKTNVYNQAINLNSRYFGSFIDQLNWNFVLEAYHQFNYLKFYNKSNNLLTVALINKYDYTWNNWKVYLGLKGEYISSNNKFKFLPTIDITNVTNDWVFTLGYHYFYRSPTGYDMLTGVANYNVLNNTFAHFEVSKEFDSGVFFSVDVYQMTNLSLPVTSNNEEIKITNPKYNIRSTYGAEVQFKYVYESKLYARGWFSFFSNYENDYEGYDRFLQNKLISPGIPSFKFGSSISYRFFGNYRVSLLYKFEGARHNIFSYKGNGVVPYTLADGHIINFKVVLHQFIDNKFDLEVLMSNILETNTFYANTYLDDPYPLPLPGRELAIRLIYKIKN